MGVELEGINHGGEKNFHVKYGYTSFALPVTNRVVLVHGNFYREVKRYLLDEEFTTLHCIGRAREEWW